VAQQIAENPPADRQRPHRTFWIVDVPILRAREGWHLSRRLGDPLLVIEEGVLCWEQEGGALDWLDFWSLMGMTQCPPAIAELRPQWRTRYRS
jgi:hypothetical protein